MSNITFGRYAPRHTFTHHMDARNKLLLLILMMVAIFLQFSYWSTTLIMSGVLLVFIVIMMLVSKIRILDLFKSLSTMWFLIIMLLAIYIFIPMSTYTHVAFTINGFKVYWEAFYQAGYIILRLAMMICLTMILTATTKPMDLTYAFEWYMYPLKAIKFPVSEIAMTLSIALRFIPTLLDETDRIMKAQASRGVDFAHGFIFKRMRAVISLIIPLFVSAIERSEELSNAMEARGYDPKAKRTRYRILHFHWQDAIGFLFVGLIFAGVLTLFITDKNMANGLNIIEILFHVNPGF
ncbi:MAG: energy-coupling factor transporter transmembrane protein EcfT [Bacilli bacterium]|nr:energy-coupling factor transporter transmembrane protein EcfT [Bacilli bacterium]